MCSGSSKYFFSDVTAAVEDDANLGVHQLQNSVTNLSTHRGAAILNKLQSLNVNFQTTSGPLNIMGKLMSSLSCTGKIIVSLAANIETREFAGKLDFHANIA